jgi:aerobic carbon-monoxide dehydrogenase small subunit
MLKSEETAAERRMVHLVVNGCSRELPVGNLHGEVAPTDTLAYTLRETLGLTGTKVGCDQGSCRSCTVLMNGKPILTHWRDTTAAASHTRSRPGRLAGGQNGIVQ